MKKKFLFCLAVSATLTLSAENLVKNSDFSAPKGAHYNQYGAWTHHYKLPVGIKISYDTEAFVSKPQSIRIDSEGATIGIRQNIKLEIGKKYKISFQMKTKEVTGEKYGAVLNICDGANRWFPTKWVLGTTPWTKYEGTFTAGKNAAKAYISLYIYGCSGTVWFDNVTLEEVK